MEFSVIGYEKFNNGHAGKVAEWSHRHEHLDVAAIFRNWETAKIISHAVRLDAGVGLEIVNNSYGDRRDGYPWSNHLRLAGP